MNFAKLVASFRNAFSGIRLLLATQQNFRIQVFIALGAAMLGIWLGLERIEWLVMLVLITFVLVLEATNTIVERQLDHLHPEIHPDVKYLKDAMAGTVFIAAIAAIIGGFVIFLPRLLAHLFLIWPVK